MDVLRFLTAGSVDDGKSTLIGRLLFENGSIYDDQLESLSSHGSGDKDLSRLTDGLRAEREQGITIDVAYRYFGTSQRKFIVADAPGHFQYTRNLVTAASNADAAIILLDAIRGITEQSIRHAKILSVMGIKDVIVAVNKMDLAGYSEEVFDEIRRTFGNEEFTFNFSPCFIPVSALAGDNITRGSEKMPWYNGPSVLQKLHGFKKKDENHSTSLRIRIQLVSRDQAGIRSYAGIVLNGRLFKGQMVRILPGGQTATVQKILTGNMEISTAEKAQSISFMLDGEIDIQRGDLVTASDEKINPSTEREAVICWFDEQILMPGRKFILQSNSFTCLALVKQIVCRYNVNDLSIDHLTKELSFNDIAKVSLKFNLPADFDVFSDLPENGRAILIDESTNNTVAACMFL